MQSGIIVSDSIKIHGVAIVALREMVNESGNVLHMLRNDAPDFTKFGECYFSEILPGAIKAWKLHHEQTQNLAVPVGRVRLVIYDDREGSSTRGAWAVRSRWRSVRILWVKGLALQ